MVLNLGAGTTNVPPSSFSVEDISATSVSDRPSAGKISATKRDPDKEGNRGTTEMMRGTLPAG